MEKLQKQIQLLALIIIFPIYRAISAIFINNFPEIILWTVISISYAISLVILYRVFKKRQYSNQIQSN
jgi:hypothetical protein